MRTSSLSAAPVTGALRALRIRQLRQRAQTLVVVIEMTVRRAGYPCWSWSRQWAARLRESVHQRQPPTASFISRASSSAVESKMRFTVLAA